MEAGAEQVVDSILPGMLHFVCPECSKNDSGLCCSSVVYVDTVTSSLRCTMCVTESCIRVIVARVLHPGYKVALFEHEDVWMLISVPPDTQIPIADTGIVVPATEPPLLAEFDAYFTGLKAVLVHNAALRPDAPIKTVESGLVADAVAAIDAVHGDSTMTLAPAQIIGFIREACFRRFADTTVRAIRECILPPADSLVHTTASSPSFLCVLEEPAQFALLGVAHFGTRTAFLEAASGFWAVMVFAPHETVPAFVSCRTDAFPCTAIHAHIMDAGAIFTETTVLDDLRPLYGLESAIKPFRYDAIDAATTRVLHVISLDDTHVLVLGKREAEHGTTFVGSVVGPPHAHVYSVLIHWSEMVWVHLVCVDIIVTQVAGTIVGEEAPFSVGISTMPEFTCCSSNMVQGAHWSRVGYCEACTDRLCSCHRVLSRWDQRL